MLGYVLEDSFNVECKEGAEAVLTCKVPLQSSYAQWTKDGKNIEQSKHYEMTNRFGQCNLKIKSTKLSDSGEYHVLIGTFSKAIQLKVIGM